MGQFTVIASRNGLMYFLSTAELSTRSEVQCLAAKHNSLCFCRSSIVDVPAPQPVTVSTFLRTHPHPQPQLHNHTYTNTHILTHNYSAHSFASARRTSRRWAIHPKATDREIRLRCKAESDTGVDSNENLQMKKSLDPRRAHGYPRSVKAVRFTFPSGFVFSNSVCLWVFGYFLVHILHLCSA